MVTAGSASPNTSPTAYSLHKKSRRPGRRAVAQLDFAAVPDALTNTVRTSRAVVLAGICSHSHPHALHGKGKHLTDLFAGRLGGHSCASQKIDGILHDDRAYGGNGVFKAHGKADAGQPA